MNKFSEKPRRFSFGVRVITAVGFKLVKGYPEVAERGCASSIAGGYFVYRSDETGGCFSKNVFGDYSLSWDPKEWDWAVRSKKSVRAEGMGEADRPLPQNKTDRPKPPQKTNNPSEYKTHQSQQTVVDVMSFEMGSDG